MVGAKKLAGAVITNLVFPAMEPPLPAALREDLPGQFLSF